MTGLPPGIDFSKIPSKEPPPGVIPDFTKRSPLLDFTIAASGIFIPLMFVFLGIRLYMRGRQREKWMADDSVAVATAIVCTCLSGLILASAQKLARHSWDVPLSDVISPETQKSMVAQHVFNSSSLWLGKFCLLTMYYRLFGHIQKVRWQIYGAAVCTLPLFFAIIIQPVLVAPVAGKPWGTPNPLVEKAVIPGLMVGVDNLAVDLMIAYIPIPVISKLNLPQSKKNGIIILFATGLIAVITDIVTLYFRVKLFQRVDQLLYGYIAHNCALIESSISVILSSLPSTAKLWRVCIEPSQIYQSLRSRLATRGSENGSTIHRELPTFIKVARSPVRRKRDPYSIGFPTTNISQGYLSEDTGLELTLTKHGLVKAQITAEITEEIPMAGDIYRTVDVEQSSVSYPDSEKSGVVRDMV